MMRNRGYRPAGKALLEGDTIRVDLAIIDVALPDTTGALFVAKPYSLHGW